MTNPAPTKIRKKPVVVEAMQFDGSPESADDILGWIERCDPETTAQFYDPATGEFTGEPHLVIGTIEGPMRAGRGWWVIRGIKGEFYPCEPEVLAGSYDFVEDDEPPADEIEPGLAPRRFFLHRTGDVTGVHADGVIATGVQFADGTVVLSWLPGKDSGTFSVAVWPRIDDMRATHLHPRSNTTLIWVD